MSTSVRYKPIQRAEPEDTNISSLVESSFKKIAPFWPLQNLIAVNPLQGFENLPIEEALKIGAAYFEQADLPPEMLLINIETIKWLGVYCDEGQATITMPLRKQGFFMAWRQLAVYDQKLHKNCKEKIAFLKSLPESPDQIIEESLRGLDIAKEQQQEFLTLLLTTLPGWASYIKYKSEWAQTNVNSHEITQLDYVALRIVITRMIWQQAFELLNWHKKALANSQNTILEKIQTNEKMYRSSLLKKLVKQKIQEPLTPEAQLVFCIDVRSEPFRKCLESTGFYQTFGVAGFFGIPAQITDTITDISYASCPVLLNPKHEVFEAPYSTEQFLKLKKSYDLKQFLRRLYQSLKYTFAAPFALVEGLGGLSGLWMGIRTISPKLASTIRGFIKHNKDIRRYTELTLENVSFQSKCTYAENLLRMMGLTRNFSSIVVLCGHGSSTQNNAYATALDCGACGGRHGGNNAKILAAIMNCSEVKMQLAKKGIKIPETTKFIAAEHNTTTDEVVLFSKNDTQEIQKLKNSLMRARDLNIRTRLKKLGMRNCTAHAAQIRAHDWAEVRPEWGLARNAAFIIAPRDLTASLDLDGRCFLHSYDHKQDPQGVFLTTILTAPVIVAQWISMQYLFSTVNNIAYGSGSKITKNITGKIGVMQGNASDLMNGLPLQSLYQSDTKHYHEPQRLMVVAHVPKIMVKKIILAQPTLQNLVGNGWVQMAVMEPDDNKIYLLKNDFSWAVVN